MIRRQPLEPNFPLGNDVLAERLNEIADLLDAQEANPYRAGAYRQAAQTIRGLDRPVHEILGEAGTAGLTAMPGIGASLGRTVDRLTKTGRLPLLEQLRGTIPTERRLATVPGIGLTTALRIHADLGIETLADLEAAAYDGRLARVPGIGRKRLRAVRESLAGRGRPRLRPPKSKTLLDRGEPTPIGELLSIDEEYRRKVKADRLLRIAPRRFNPTGKAWLPILRTRRGDRHYTALYSNTARAHELGAVRDWVVIFRDPASGGGQWTVITSRFGKLQGRRIIRGLERECAAYYAGPGSEIPKPSQNGVN